MGRILAIDYGRKRVGVAVTDPLQITANGLNTVPAHDIMDFLDEYLKEEKVDTIVVGLPTRMNNEPSEAMEYIRPFVKRLKKKHPEIPVEMIDERYTSKMAKQAMIDGGLGKKARQDKALVDKVSATIILQSYMQQNNS